MFETLALLTPYRSMIGLTLKVACYATLFATLLGVALAWLFYRYHFWGKHFLDSVLTLPMVLPPTVLGYYLLVWFGRNGVIGPWLLDTFGLQLVFTWQGAVVAATVVAFPLVFKSALAAFENLNSRYMAAAQTLGVPNWVVFFRVAFPLSIQGITAGILLAFARAMGEFGATLMLAGNLPGRTQTLSLAVYDAVQAGDTQEANVLVFLITLVCLVILTLTGKLLSPKRARIV